MPSKRTVLITGCSQGSLGEALALGFHSRGLRFIATARSVSRLKTLEIKGIDILPLDVTDPFSITSCISSVSKITNGHLDILLNNSGGGYSMPLVDASLGKAREVFELNVFSIIAMTQAFMPLLLKSEHGAMIVNNTSISLVATVPMTGVYNASKAAAAMLTDNLRLELAHFKIRVVDLKTGAVRSGFYDNMNSGTKPGLPDDSIYGVARAEVERSMLTGCVSEKNMVAADVWAGHVVEGLLVKEPELRIWKGGNSWLTWVAKRFMPFTFLDGEMVKMGSLDVVKKNVGGGKRKSVAS
ncbi:MAG: hypothetical protein ALECFALPRED_002305 [Alectoria fallacina]|uniref:Uncharacterized protein n=1 Tax=Alectoria fallacina TaxID=1903189 RepID=A0A8H3ILA0_9LECA|nr:MAG: hypothetical protein ALECFALPRED_002305 [Alectoria fallacina]